MTIERRQKQKAEYVNVQLKPKESRKSSSVVIQKNSQDIAYDKEVQAFVDMVTHVRSKYKFDDPRTNLGLVISSKITSTYPEHTSVKILVHFDRCLTKDNLVKFTCDVSSTIEHIIFKVIADIAEDLNADKFILQVFGINEYLENESQLQDYEYVHQCYKFDKDVEFILIQRDEVDKSLARSAKDDANDSKVSRIKALYIIPLAL